MVLDKNGFYFSNFLHYLIINFPPIILSLSTSFHKLPHPKFYRFASNIRFTKSDKNLPSSACVIADNDNNTFFM